MNLKTLLFCFLSGISFSQTWEQITDFPGSARDDGSSFTIGTNHYTGLGRDVGFNCTRDFFVFNSSNSSWTSSSSLPMGEERQYAVGTAWNGGGYIFGGAKCDNTFLNDLWSFDPSNQSWIELSPLPSSGRAGSEHFIIADTLYIIGGRNSLEILSEVWAYDFTADTWSQKTNYPDAGVWRGISFKSSTNGYVGLGKNNLDNQSAFNSSIHSFDPQTQTWTSMPDLGVSPRYYIGHAQINEQVLLFGGLDPSNAILSSFDRIDLTNWTLQGLPDFTSEARKGSMCFVADETFYTTTGVSSIQRLNDTWRISQILGTNEIQSNSILVYPNPASNSCFLELENKSNENFTILSIDGRIISEQSSNHEKIITIDLSLLESGYYLLLSGLEVVKLEVRK